MAGEDNSAAVPTGHAEDYVHFTFSPLSRPPCVVMVLMMSAAVVAVVAAATEQTEAEPPTIESWPWRSQCVWVGWGVCVCGGRGRGWRGGGLNSLTKQASEC